MPSLDVHRRGRRDRRRPYERHPHAAKCEVSRNTIDLIGWSTRRFSTSTNPGAVISSYQQALAGAGWTVTGSGGTGSSSGGGAGLQATNGPKYLSVNAGGPTGMTYVSVCVWPAKPHDNNCGDND